MGAMVPGEDEQPATRRDLSNEREVTAANARAGFAELRTDMAEGFRETDQKISAVSAKVELRTDMVDGFRETDQKISAVSAKVDGLRTDMVEGFRETDKEIAALRVDVADASARVDRRMTNQTRFLAGLMVTMCGALLAAVLQTG